MFCRSALAVRRRGRQGGELKHTRLRGRRAALLVSEEADHRAGLTPTSGVQGGKTTGLASCCLDGIAILSRD